MAMHERRAVREDVSPNPMSLSAWAQVVGTYVGPIRSANRRFGNDGVNTMDVRLEISGSPEYPLIFLQTRTAFSGALILSGERAETFTNIPERHYGVRASVAATSHDPDQLRLMLKSQPLSPTLGGFMTLTFRGRGCAEVDFIEHAGRRGDGILKRLPRLPGVCRE
ncbi:MAG: hypothetical protein QOD99_2843 [Chthoniobacter sp.]|jgi:hypothetical protein|nr:hypothetical protein [Chthoniobacter sp.]